jgi:NitT/TauT family transport system substrate-binding protein
MKLWLRSVGVMLIAICTLSVQAKEKYSVVWTHYVGWEPWAYAQESGILKKWADKYDIEISLTLLNDYIESINLYTAGEYDACVMTNMDALTIPAASGKDSTALIVGDYSNGNDGIVLRKAHNISELKGKEVLLVEYSVSHYLLARALEMNGMSEEDVKVINVSNADITLSYLTAHHAAVVTWNPPLQKVQRVRNANLLFDSSQIPGEILDLMVVRTDADEKFKKALVGAWYETMADMSTDGAARKKAIAAMAQSADVSPAEFELQLKTTEMFYTPEKALEIARSEQLISTMDQVRRFSFDKGLFGAGAKSVDFVGIEFYGNKTLGDDKNVKLRFDTRYMELARDNKL